jgi:hypothetical protein
VDEKTQSGKEPHPEERTRNSHEKEKNKEGFPKTKEGFPIFEIRRGRETLDGFETRGS